jgi:hypothetical protein
MITGAVGGGDWVAFLGEACSEKVTDSLRLADVLVVKAVHITVY